MTELAIINHHFQSVPDSPTGNLSDGCSRACAEAQADMSVYDCFISAFFNCPKNVVVQLEVIWFEPEFVHKFESWHWHLRLEDAQEAGAS